MKDIYNVEVGDRYVLEVTRVTHHDNSEEYAGSSSRRTLSRVAVKRLPDCDPTGPLWFFDSVHDMKAAGSMIVAEIAELPDDIQWPLFKLVREGGE